MIYIFKGCGEICKLPCTICKGCCDAFNECCKGCNDCIDPVISNPLGNYVIATWVAMAFALAASGWGLVNLNECDDDTKGKLALFCIADCALALVHSGMAYYMQRQIVAGLGGKDYKSMTAKEIQAEAGRILLYDVPVCLYFFLANAAWAMNLWGLTLGSCGSVQPQFGAAALMICWGCCAGGYLVCWYCCQCCQGTVSSIKKPGSGPGGTIMGQPVGVKQ
jgi:hypothetical protein